MTEVPLILTFHCDFCGRVGGVRPNPGLLSGGITCPGCWFLLYVVLINLLLERLDGAP